MGGRGASLGGGKGKKTDETATETGPVSSPAQANARWDKSIYDSIEQLGGRDKNGWASWVGLVDLRPLLGGTRAEQDANLKRLSNTGAISIAPESNRKVLNANDHAAAIRIGGQDNHIVQWNHHDHPRPEVTVPGGQGEADRPAQRTVAPYRSALNAPIVITARRGRGRPIETGVYPDQVESARKRLTEQGYTITNETGLPPSSGDATGQEPRP